MVPPFNPHEPYPETQHDRYLRLCGARTGAVFVLGSGASLIENDLSAFRGCGVPVACLNHSVFFSHEFEPDYWIFAHTDRQDFQSYLHVARYRKITAVPCWLLDPIFDGENVVPYYPKIEKDWLPSVLDHAMHVLSHMGFSRIILVGCDGYRDDRDHVMSHDFPNTGPTKYVDIGHLATHGIVASWQSRGLRIESAGAYHGVQFIKHMALSDAIKSALGG